jgi:UDP-2,3-diacylglucosamine pyrophosphatase LpxH
MRTLIVSDLHLGQRPGHDVLRLPEPREALLAALDGVDRLVLLGDIVELASRVRGRRSMEIAAPALRAIARRMGPEREIVLVPGNHDSAMIRSWTRARGRALGLAETVAPGATPALAEVTGLLSGARVRVSYPGVWVRDDVWATHGHYLDRHLIPESTFGLPRGRRPREPSAALPIEYEWARRRRRHTESDSLWARLRERPLAVVLEQLAELTRYGTYVLRGMHLTALTSALLDLQVRRAAVPAMELASTRLGVEARWIVFGHVHRAGPAEGEQWRPRADGPRLLNTGSWVYEPLLLDRATPPHPYWPGGAVLVEDGADPRSIGLLDAVDGERLSGGRRRRGEDEGEPLASGGCPGCGSGPNCSSSCS